MLDESEMKMLKLTSFHIDLYIILLVLFLFSVSCGTSQVVSSPESSEFTAWKETIPSSPSEFVSWWNSQEKANWKFSYYGENGIVYPDSSTPEEVWRSKIINCNRFIILFKPVLGGKIRVYPQEGYSYSHVTLVLATGEELSLCGTALTIKESD